MKKAIKILALLLALTMLAGCGASSIAGMKNEMAMEMPMATEAASMASGSLTGTMDSVAQEVSADQKLIKRVNMDAETEDLEALLPRLFRQVLPGQIHRLGKGLDPIVVLIVGENI